MNLRKVKKEISRVEALALRQANLKKLNGRKVERQKGKKESKIAGCTLDTVLRAKKHVICMKEGPERQ